jgi:transcriptional regulator
MTYVPESMPQPTTMEAAAYAANIGFGSIIVNVEDRFFASHVPVFIDISDGSAKELRFHLAARNEMVQALNNSPHAVVIVRGPDGYISPKWYDHENVPTWDYAVVQLEGEVATLNTPALKAHVLELLYKFDPDFKVRDAYIDQYLSWIKGFSIPSPKIEPVFKLSQDKNKASIEGVLSGLRSRGEDLDQSLAQAIQRWYPSSAHE